MKYFEKISGERVFLSPINEDDYEKYCVWLNDADVGVYADTLSKNFSIEKQKAVLRQMSHDNNAFAVVIRESNIMIGDCTIVNIDNISRSAELGIWIGDKTKWNCGYGTEVLKLLTKYSFDVLNMNSLMGRIFSFNERSIKICLKNGFTQCGVRHEAYYSNGNYYDEIYMEYLRSNYYKGWAT